MRRRILYIKRRVKKKMKIVIKKRKKWESVTSNCGRDFSSKGNENLRSLIALIFHSLYSVLRLLDFYFSLLSHLKSSLALLCHTTPLSFSLSLGLRFYSISPTPFRENPIRAGWSLRYPGYGDPVCTIQMIDITRL